MTENSYLYPTIAVLSIGTIAAYFLFLKKKEIKFSLSKTDWKTFPLLQKTAVSHNTFIYKFGLESSEHELGLPIGQHISLAATINGKEIIRSYTPIESTLGHFDLLIKTYENGNISKYVSQMKIGDRIKVKGPKGQFKYTSNMCKEIGMIAGGTGITPMWQIIHAVLSNPDDLTKLSLLFANVNEEDILMKKDLDDLAIKHPNRFQVNYILNNPPSDWKGLTGFVNKEMIGKYLPKYTIENKILLCGPPPMTKAMEGHCQELGYPPAEVISKMHHAIFKF